MCKTASLNKLQNEIIEIHTSGMQYLRLSMTQSHIFAVQQQHVTLPAKIVFNTKGKSMMEMSKSKKHAQGEARSSKDTSNCSFQKKKHMSLSIKQKNKKLDFMWAKFKSICDVLQDLHRQMQRKNKLTGKMYKYTER